jgi:hypothetical protein
MITDEFWERKKWLTREIRGQTTVLLCRRFCSLEEMKSGDVVTSRNCSGRYFDTFHSAWKQPPSLFPNRLWSAPPFSSISAAFADVARFSVCAAADKRYSLELAMSEPFVQCDCCDYFTITAGNDYEICPVCFWEQDAFGVSEPDEPSGANHSLSLHEGRNNFLVFGACAVRFKVNVIAVPEREKYRHVARAI